MNYQLCHAVEFHIVCYRVESHACTAFIEALNVLDWFKCGDAVTREELCAI